jgi:hypothetical protein
MFIMGHLLAEIETLAPPLNETIESRSQALRTDEEFSDMATTPLQLSQLLQEWKCIAMSGSDTLSPTSLASLARTVVWGMDAGGGRTSPGFIEEFTQYLEFMENMMEDHDEGWWADAAPILTSVEGVLLRKSGNRCLGRTTNGDLGSMPGGTKVGDKICVFYGGTVPYTIRPCGNGEYRFLGECYFDGFMDGEAMDLGIESEGFILV